MEDKIYTVQKKTKKKQFEASAVWVREIKWLFSSYSLFTLCVSAPLYMAQQEIKHCQWKHKEDISY